MKAMLTELPFQYLAELQLKIARRADQLREKFGGGRENDRRVWLRAEFEILERLERERPAVLSTQIPWVAAR
jgi:hypothetical protein